MAVVESADGTVSMVVPGAPKHPTLAAALAAFQAEVPRMQKDETAKVTGKNGQTGEKVSYKYGYAGLDQFVEIAEPVLGKHGLAITSLATFDDKGNYLLEVKLVHEGGEELGPSIWPLPDPRRFGPQDIGSSMTYGRRYLGWGLTGTFPGGIDDDGQQAQQAARESWDDAKPAQAMDQHRRGVNHEGVPQAAKPGQPTDEQVRGWHEKLITFDQVQAGKLYDWLVERNLHNRPVNNGAQANTATTILAVRLATTALDMSTSLADVETISDFADRRGLLKIPVSEMETLSQALESARELRIEEKLDGSDYAAELRGKAASSWADEPVDEPVER